MPTTLDRWAHGRVAIALRWWITRTGEVRHGWPDPGLEGDAIAMGWIGHDEGVGVIEVPAPPVDLGVLDLLEERFPGRRWYAGDWEATAAPMRLAA